MGFEVFIGFKLLEWVLLDTVEIEQISTNLHICVCFF